MTSAWPVYIGTGLFTNSGSQCATVDAWAGAKLGTISRASAIITNPTVIQVAATVAMNLAMSHKVVARLE